MESGAPQPRVDQPAALSLKGVACSGDGGRAGLREVSLEVHPGEILGIAGVAGNGQSELAEVITGLREIQSGTLSVLGLSATSDIAARRCAGLAHIPEDRQGRGLCTTFTVEENTALGRQAKAPFARGPWIDFEGRRREATAMIGEMDIRPPLPTALARNLSGGNQQKVVVGRELGGHPKVVVAVQPTHGLDIGASANVHRRLSEARASGAAIVLISMDLDEVRSLSDRVSVMYEGRLTDPLPVAEASEARLGRLMLGQTAT
jgi:simple sugar transport system ATP-binding protein